MRYLHNVHLGTFLFGTFLCELYKLLEKDENDLFFSLKLNRI